MYNSFENRYYYFNKQLRYFRMLLTPVYDANECSPSRSSQNAKRCTYQLFRLSEKKQFKVNRINLYFALEKRTFIYSR